MMNKAVKTKPMTYIAAIIVVGVVFVMYWLGVEISYWFLMKCISTSVALLTVVFFVFCKWIWKWPIFKKWLVLVPNLNGIWTGTIESNWINPETGEKVPAIDATLKIKQSLFSVSCVMETSEMKSWSVAAEFILDPDNQVSQLVYTYNSTPLQHIQKRSRMHYGTVMFDIESEEMKGNYWTGRETAGIINVKWKSKLKK